jgi:hypothetical protein
VVVLEFVRNFRRMETSENLAAGLVAGFRLPKRESMHSVIFTNEDKSHERTKSEVRRHKSWFEV